MDIKRETERAIKAVSDARTTYVRAIRLHLKCIDHHDTPYHYADISLRNAEEMLTAALMSDVCKPNAPHQARRGSGVALNAVVVQEDCQ